jgi:short subunit dehydrogenase-like uncharacterized protein
MPEVVVFGAAGYTGRLAVAALAQAGRAAVLAGRDRGRLDELAGRYPGTRVAIADATDPASVRGILRPGDVLVSTVGPFVRYGEAALSAAVDVGAHYVDSTGEAPFVRTVFQEYGERARQAGVVALTAVGYDYVPGNLAGALAAREAGPDARRVDVGYFLTGTGQGMSSGTRASLATGITLPHHAYRDGRLRLEPAARRVRHFSADGRSADGRSAGGRRPGFSIGATEQFTLPALYPHLRDVNVYLGWLGNATRMAQVASYTQPLLLRLPGGRRRLDERAERALRRTGTGPDADARAASGSLVVAEAFDGAGRRLARVDLSGVNGYDLTGRLLAWVATSLADGAADGAGALGPVQAFGLDRLAEASHAAGLTRVESPAATS